MRTRRRAAALGGALSIVALAGCGGTDEETGRTRTEETPGGVETTDDAGATDGDDSTQEDATSGTGPTEPGDDTDPSTETPSGGTDDDGIDPDDPREPIELQMPLAETVDVEALDELRSQHVGDNSAVIALASAAGMPEVADYTVELHTDEEPYGITFHIDEDTTDLEMWELLKTMEDRGVLLLATVENLDEIYFLLSDGESGAYLERSRADDMVGTPVAELGSDADGLREIVQILDSQVPEHGVG